MTTTKPVNPSQLQKEALAVGAPHIELTLAGGTPDASGIIAAGASLWCSCTPGSSSTTEPCASCLTAYNAHVAAASNPPPTFGLLPATGVGATGSVAAGSNDQLMAGTIHTGSSGTAAGDILTVTFGTPRAAAPLVVQVGALNVQAGTLVAKNVTANGFTIATSAVPAAGTTYTLWAHVPG